MLGQEAAVAGNEADIARMFAQHFRHARDTVHGVVVQRAAGK